MVRRLGISWSGGKKTYHEALAVRGIKKLVPRLPALVSVFILRVC
jgi:hypothetical protein